MFLWNWKTAALSAFCRASLFALAALHSGRAAALKAMCVELFLAAVLAGFQGAFTQRMRGVEPLWRSTLVCAARVSLINHPLEFAVHTLARTPRTGRGIAVSFLFTLLATHLSLRLMRQGLFLTGSGRQALADDLRALPAAVSRSIFADQRSGLIKH